jgi:hypothetical protein
MFAAVVLLDREEDGVIDDGGMEPGTGKLRG